VRRIACRSSSICNWPAFRLTASAEANFPDDPATFIAADPSGYEEEATRPLGPIPTDAVEQLRPLIELGVSHVTLYPHSLRTLERFGGEVAPELAKLGPWNGNQTSA
jgi:hypothetical protein